MNLVHVRNLDVNQARQLVTCASDQDHPSLHPSPSWRPEPRRPARQRRSSGVEGEPSPGYCYGQGMDTAVRKGLSEGHACLQLHLQRQAQLRPISMALAQVQGRVLDSRSMIDLLIFAAPIAWRWWDILDSIYTGRTGGRPEPFMKNPSQFDE